MLTLSFFVAGLSGNVSVDIGEGFANLGDIRDAAGLVNLPARGMRGRAVAVIFENGFRQDHATIRQDFRANGIIGHIVIREIVRLSPTSDLGALL
jgi:hypothetical protein